MKPSLDIFNPAAEYERAFDLNRSYPDLEPGDRVALFLLAAAFGEMDAIRRPPGKEDSKRVWDEMMKQGIEGNPFLWYRVMTDDLLIKLKMVVTGSILDQIAREKRNEAD